MDTVETTVGKQSAVEVIGQLDGSQRAAVVHLPAAELGIRWQGRAQVRRRGREAIRATMEIAAGQSGEVIAGGKPGDTGPGTFRPAIAQPAPR